MGNTMRGQAMRGLGAAATLLFAAGLLAGCGATPDPSTDTGSSESATPESSPSDEVTDEVAPADTFDCLEGEWQLTESELQNYFDQMETPAEFKVVGGTGLNFSADTYEYVPEYALNMVVAGQEAEASLTGSIRGDYTADEGVVTTSNEANDVEIVVTVGGTVMDVGEAFDSFMGMSPVNSAQYTCNATGPLLMFQAGEAGEVPMQLEPAN